METETRRERTVTWEDPFIVLQNAPGKTGLELLREILEGRLPQAPIANLMGFEIVSAEKGNVVFEGEPGEYLYNPIGVIHAGFAMTLLDSAMGCAVHSTLGVGERYTTLETKANFVRPITLGTGRVRCEGAVLHRGGTVATAEGKVFAIGSGKVLAHGTTTCLIARSA